MPTTAQMDITVSEAAWPLVDRRAGEDRRLRPTRMLSRHTFFGGRRARGRRDSENVNCFMDQFGQGVFFFATLILLLNMLDAFFTLYFLGLGGEELNPVALFLLELGPGVFIAAKTIGIGLCTMYLVLVKRFRGVNFGIGAVVVMYLALMCWHTYLYAHVNWL